jgi:hypothetical protein
MAIIVLTGGIGALYYWFSIRRQLRTGTSPN